MSSLEFISTVNMIIIIVCSMTIILHPRIKFPFIIYLFLFGTALSAAGVMIQYSSGAHEQIARTVLSSMVAMGLTARLYKLLKEANPS